jgi:soluble lytic murein transglycosylase-like protein
MSVRAFLALLLILGSVNLAPTPASADDDTYAAAVIGPINGRDTLARAEASMDAGRYREALDALDAGPVPPEAADLVAVRRAELALNLGNGDRAAAELAKPEMGRTTNRMLLVRAAQIAERAGQAAAAAELWLRSAGQPCWSAERFDAWKSAALDYARAGQNERAADVLAALVDAGARSPSMARDLAPLASLGSHHAALVALIGGDTATAASAFARYLAENPNGMYAVAAQRRLAALNQPRSRDDWAAARDADTADAYRAWAEAHRGDPRVVDARFYEGFADYRDGSYAAALGVWSSWTGPDVPTEARARALYWAGKALIQLDQVYAGRQRWVAAAGLKPSSYYSVRAADRLNGYVGWPDGGQALPGAPGAAEDAEVERWMLGWAGPARPPSDAEAASLVRASLFAGLGLPRTASAELDTLIQNSDNPRVVYRAGQIAAQNALWEAAVRAGVRIGGMAPSGTSVDAPRGVRRLSYPTAFRDAVQTGTSSGQLGPLLLLSLMRQESRFDPYAVSVADARGLTQVIPSTGAEIAKVLGRVDFAPDQLYDPNLSVVFGAQYLADQIKQFDGDIFRAVAAYNAGGGAVARWAPGWADPDVFVESIPYAETRAYVKSIYEYHAVYRSLVQGQ